MPMPLPHTQTPRLGLAVRHFATDGGAVVGIVDRLRAVGTDVDDVMFPGLEMHDERSLERETRVIRADRDPHDITLRLSALACKPD
jgi:hypothetical protein